jgi:predicted enzyme related to lactoylglutathione lyase
MDGGRPRGGAGGDRVRKRTARLSRWRGRLACPAVDFRLELVQVPVADVDRAKSFYVDKVGFNADQDHTVSDEVRFVQLTPPGSSCSIAIGRGLSDMPPGSVEGLQLVVDDVEAARAELADRGVEVSEVQTFPWGSFVFFSDPDGNGWAVQELPER